jgi:hypothetical protein
MHEPPESMKQHKLKPWKKPPDPPIDASPDNLQSKQQPKKKLPSVDNMDKKNLVLAMQRDHPTRTLNIGTLNANATRALQKKFPPSAAAIFLPKVKISLQRVTRLSAQIKRTCERAIGSSLERLSLDYIEEDDIADGTTTEGTAVDGTAVGSSTGNIKHKQSLKKVPEIDRLILEKLCPAFSEKDLAAFGNRVEQEPVNSETVDEHDDSNDNKNEPLQFLLSLCNAIHSRTFPNEKGIGVHVCAFIKQANMSLPPMTKDRTPLEYAGSAFLRSTAVQLSIELRKHYKNGSIELCKQVRK